MYPVVSYKLYTLDSDLRLAHICYYNLSLRLDLKNLYFWIRYLSLRLLPLIRSRKIKDAVNRLPVSTLPQLSLDADGRTSASNPPESIWQGIYPAYGLDIRQFYRLLEPFVHLSRICERHLPSRVFIRLEPYRALRSICPPKRAQNAPDQATKTLEHCHILKLFRLLPCRCHYYGTLWYSCPLWCLLEKARTHFAGLPASPPQRTCRSLRSRIHPV